MPDSIDSCPGCQAPVLSDTTVCPSCGRVLKDDGAKLFSEGDGIGLVTAEMEDPCRKCGQMVRSGLLRCWNCNEFMRQDIADRYKQMQATPQRILYSETDANEFLPPRTEAKGAAQPTFMAEDADFAMDDDVLPDIRTTPGGEFELGQDLESSVPPETTAPPAAATGGGFDLSSPAGVNPTTDAVEEQVIETIPLAKSPSDAQTQADADSTDSQPLPNESAATGTSVDKTDSGSTAGTMCRKFESHRASIQPASMHIAMSMAIIDAETRS
jgi:hypothetical protein